MEEGGEGVNLLVKFWGDLVVPEIPGGERRSGEGGGGGQKN